jgi:hypothetical protein
MRFGCGDVRDLIVSHKTDHGPAHRRYGALQQWRCLKICFREIFGIVRFSTFATISAHSCPDVCDGTSAVGESRHRIPRRIRWSTDWTLLRAFGVLISHSPSAILCLPAFVSRSSPGNSSMYSSRISRSLCSGGIVRCIGPLAQLRSDTNSSGVNGGADKPCAIPHICAPDCPFSS